MPSTSMAISNSRTTQADCRSNISCYNCLEISLMFTPMNGVKALLACGTVLVVLTARSQVILNADGPGNTYEIINSALGGTAEETPDCSDPAFGRHITEDFDSILG